MDTPNTVLNQYAILDSDAAPGHTSLMVADAASLDSPFFGPLEAGDVIMVYQAQGAAIDTSDTPLYGSITSLNHAGRYELATVQDVTGNRLNLDSACGLKHSYTAADHVQIIRVPQFSTLTVTASGSITAAPWDGQKGGVVAVRALNSVVLDGPIDVTGLGFRGGLADNESQSAALDITGFRSAIAADGGEKGESVAGSAATYAALGGQYGRGAPANGGGGGNSRNAGGGGGANGHSGMLWLGHGIMDSGVPGAPAWALDPAHLAGGGIDSSGGGRGGYTSSANDADALSIGPDQADWGGNFRRDRGGWGGRPLLNDPSGGRLFFGGGGGAGDGNNSGAGGGGRGGGIAFLLADSVSGTSAVLANGLAGAHTSVPHNDAPGGGGAGGSVFIHANGVRHIAIHADGGAGGNQLSANHESAGPGGGGSGGFIAVAGDNLTTSALGGSHGMTTSLSVTEFAPNGATRGAPGQSSVALVPLADLPVCVDPDIDLDGIPDSTEIEIGTNPGDADSDDDGAPDGLEPSYPLDSDGDGIINALDPDSDNDGLFDGTEIGFDCSGPGTDASLGYCIPDGDGGETTTNALDPDNDEGGVSDGDEDTDKDGVVDGGEKDPNDYGDDTGEPTGTTGGDDRVTDTVGMDSKGALSSILGDGTIDGAGGAGGDGGAGGNDPGDAGGAGGNGDTGNSGGSSGAGDTSGTGGMNDTGGTGDDPPRPDDTIGGCFYAAHPLNADGSTPVLSVALFALLAARRRRFRTV